MRRSTLGAGGFLFCAALAFAAHAQESPSSVRGDWRLNNWTPGSSVNLTMGFRKGDTRWQWGNDQPLGDLPGLTVEQLRSVHAPVTFALKRDAGTFAFDGTVVLGIGFGEFSFVPDPDYRAKLAALGFEDVDGGAAALMMMAVRDVSLAYAAEVKRLGLRSASVSDLARLRDHGVDLEFIRELATTGYAGLTCDEVVRLREHGVEPRYLARIRSAGFDGLTIDEVIRLREHGVD